LSQISGPLTISSSQDTGSPYGLTVATNGTIDLSTAGSVIAGNTIANSVATVGPITAQGSRPTKPADFNTQACASAGGWSGITIVE
jgi:hypothetical protein